MNEMLEKMGKNAKEAEVTLRSLSTNKKNEVLLAVADNWKIRRSFLSKLMNRMWKTEERTRCRRAWWTGCF